MRVLFAMTILAGIAGAVCLYVATLSPAYVDESGMLVEPFAWMASGRLLLILFSAGFVATALLAFFRTRKRGVPG